MNIALTLRRIKTLLKRSLQEFAEDHGTAMAAAISYYVLFSMFPLLIFAVGIIGIVIQDEGIKADIIDMVLDVIPLDESGDEQLVENIERIRLVGSGAFGLVGLLGLAWSGSNMFAIIRRSLNIAFDVDSPRPFARQKLVDFMMIGLVGLLFLGSISATAILRITRALADDMPLFGGLSQAMGFGWDVASFLVPVAVSLSAFFLIYYVVPATRVRARDALVGALLAGLIFELGKVGFSVYLENFGNYNAIYGSLGTVVIFLFWVFISANILILCGELTSELPGVMRGDHDESGVPTAESLLPWHVRMRRMAIGVLRGLFFYEEEEERRRRT